MRLMLLVTSLFLVEQVLASSHGIVGLTTGERAQARTDDIIMVMVNCAGGTWGVESTLGPLEQNSVNKLFYKTAPCAPTALVVEHTGTNNWEFERVDIAWRNCDNEQESKTCSAAPNQYYRNSSNPINVDLTCSNDPTVTDMGYVDLETGDDFYAPTDDVISVTVSCTSGAGSWGTETTTRDISRSSVNRLGFNNAHCPPGQLTVSKPGDNAWEFKQATVYKGSCTPVSPNCSAHYGRYLGMEPNFPNQPSEVDLPLWNCYEKRSCLICNDPHVYSSWDGSRFDFHQLGVYHIASLCTSVSGIPDFELTGEHYCCGCATCIGYINLDVYGKSYKLTNNIELFVDGALTGTTYDDGHVTVTQNGCKITLSTDFGLLIEFYGGYIKLTMDEKLASSTIENVYGICGRHNYIPGDDYHDGVNGNNCDLPPRTNL